MPMLEKGKVIKTAIGEPITVVSYYSRGGQAELYLAKYCGETKILKWYFPKSIADHDAFYENLKRNVNRGSPDKTFIWPQAVTEKTDGSFGYIMDIKPDNYYELGKIIGTKYYDFKSFQVAIEACIKIVSAFRILHSIGYSYQDLNDGNFFVNTSNGDVLIGDNDNVAPNDENTGIIGKPRYIAPEIVVGNGNVMPNIWTDRYSLSAILFLSLFANHPLEGRRWLVDCLTDKLASKLYGSEPIFVFDPNDDRNAPVPNKHVTLLSRWKFMPDYIREKFTEAFSQKALKNPTSRLRESDWLDVFVRCKTDIIKCEHCGNEVFIQNASDTDCEKCGNTVKVKNKIILPKYALPASKGAVIYRCQLGICNAEDTLTPVALIVSKASDPNSLGIKNLTNTTFKATTPSGREKQVAPGEVIPFNSGITFEAFNKTIKLM